MSALNLPGACRPFGHEKYWVDKEQVEQPLEARRRLRAAYSAANWIKKDRLRTDPEECDSYVDKASAEGNLFSHQSEHASLQITSPSISVRINVGKIHQLAMRDPTDKFDLPDHVAYQMNIVLEAVENISQDAQVSPMSPRYY